MEERILTMKATNVYQRTAEALKTKKIILEEGGSRSSKTFSIFQIFINLALQGEPFVLTIVRENLTWIKTTLLKDFEEIRLMYGDALEITPSIKASRQEQVYNVNGSEFGFFGLDYPQKLHGRKQDYTWMNEVMESSKISFDQLEMRTTKKMILDYNPIDDTHWVFDLPLRDDVAVIKSTMLDNPFNPQVVIDKILSYKPTPENYAKKTADPYMWEVYGLGNKARLEGVIFSNWDMVEEIPEDAKSLGLGLDFGFSNDPTALIDIYYYDNAIWLDELLYETGLVNTSREPKDDSIEKRMNDLDIGNDEITADSAEPKSIRELQHAGFNIEGAEKGPDSVIFGIELMKKYPIHITRRSVNLEREMRRYKWKVDKNGKSLNEPVDEYNHGIDGARYRITKMLRKHHEVKLYPRGLMG